MRRCNIFFFLIVILILNNCSDSPQNIVEHPRADSISVLSELPNTLNLNESDNSDTLISSYSDSIIIKKNDLMVNGFIANLLDIDTDTLGRIYVALGPENVIKVFSSSGSYLFSVGGSGRGPGEFEMLRDIYVNKDLNLLIALDSNEIEIFDLLDDGVKHRKAIFTGMFNSSQVCAIGDNIYVNGSIITNNADGNSISDFSQIQASKPIHQVDIETEEVRSFGRVYKSAIDYGVFNGMLSNTIISCNVETKKIIGVFGHWPLFAGYSSDDLEEQWVSGLIGIDHQIFEENTKAQTLQRKQPSEIIDRYTFLTALPNEYSLLQIGFEIPERNSIDKILEFSKMEESKLRGVLINSIDGSLIKLKPERYFYYYLGNEAAISLRAGINPMDGFDLIYKNKPIYNYE
ncbi:MAG: 6-bladed beta-propeller [Balneolaceae bacterium]|nr:6-bladed beta-propeller [Balneolaceae bacterium]